MTVNEVLNKLAAYCSASERCPQDVRKKLVQWEIPDEKHAEIIQKLKQEKFLDEERFCRAFTNDKLKFNKWGIIKIRYELRKKEMPENIIQKILDAIDIEGREAILIQLLNSKKKTVKGKNEYEIKQKLIRFAAGRGFAISEIEKYLNSGEWQTANSE